MTRDQRFVAGAGATEIELAKRLQTFGDATTGLTQYAIKKFGEALEVIPRTLAENSGVKATDFISNLYAAHQRGQIYDGVNIEVKQTE
jgi:T-complex protein 1 subunit theta